MTTETRTPAIDATTTLGDGNHTIEAPTGFIHLVFGSGATLTIATNELSPTIRGQAMLHGLKQKLVDAAAISRNPDTGRSATIDDKYNAVREVYDRLLSGQWNKIRDGGSGTKGGLLFRALCMLYPDKTAEAIRAFLDKKTAAEKTALRNTKKIADIILTLKDDEAGDEVDTDAMLDELN
jgi:hypothetical protein